jgi:hypothetical protein
MLAGIVVFVAGLTIRAGMFAPAMGGVGPPPTPRPIAIVAVASSAPTVGPTVAIVPTSTVTPTIALAPTPSPTGQPSLGEILFADEFDTEAAWPTGQVTGAVARYEDGVYVLDAKPIDLPGYIFPAAAGEGSLPGSVVVSATFEFGGSGEQAGLVVADASGATVGALVSADGRVVLIRDSIESFDMLGSGSADVGDGPIRVFLSVGPHGTSVVVGDRVVVSMAGRVDPMAFGIGIWSQLEPATVVIDHYEVRATAGS